MPLSGLQLQDRAMTDATRRSTAILIAAALLAPACAWAQGSPRSAITETDVAAL
jgi:hypothetical protein